MVRLPRFGRSNEESAAQGVAPAEQTDAAPSAPAEQPQAEAGAPEGEVRAKRSLFGFLKDPSRRMRAAIWATAGVFVIAAVMIVALGATSSYWFCANGCHKVQDDTIMAYQHSVHNRVSCMSCHMPVGASPVTFMLHKVEALGELYMTVTNDYSLPLNAESEVSLTMKPAQCTQCHTTNRKITPRSGILIDHKKHEQAGVTCAVCHNRVAHVEDFKLVGVDPKTGKPNQKHEDFMEMTACFRCHGQEKTAEAPGACSACHPAGFQLKPAWHNEANFFPEQHGKLALEVEKDVRAAEAREKKAGEQAAEAKSGIVPASHTEGESNPMAGENLPKVETINSCFTCHKQKFCTDCHGTVMPHPADFKKNHGVNGKKNPQKCAQCHGSVDEFCNSCHHGTKLGYKYDPKQPWRTQHPNAVNSVGASTCFQCHKPTYCAECHVNGGELKQ